MKKPDRNQKANSRRTLQFFTGNKLFQTGMKHARLKKRIPLEMTFLPIGEGWMYERGRAFVVMFPQFTAMDAAKYRNGDEPMTSALRAMFAAERQ